MAADADPYRTLGLARGAPLAEVKKAYRRLAKEHHPDAAGETALPRFLAIQAAYDEIAGPGAAAATGRPGRRPSPARRPWEADPDRADATHRAYGGRSRRPKSGGSRQGADGPAGRSSRGASGSAPPSGRPARPPNKATLGSTSYDGAEAEPFEPDWGGASWYGTTSGTYWTLNPKEYADPRKHGPEYQARARRAAAARDAGGPSTADAAADAAGTAEEPVTAESTDAAGTGTGTSGGETPTHTTVSWWDATSGAESRTAPKRTAETPRSNPDAAPDPTSSAPEPSAAAAATATAIGWAWLEADQPGLVARIGRALLGWVPIALGVGWGVGELSGCGRFTAACDPAVTGSTWIVQLAVLVALLLVPRIAAVAAVGAVAALVAAVPAAVLVTASGGVESVGTGSSGGSTLLGGLVAIAWIAGMVVGVVRASRRGARPLS